MIGWILFVAWFALGVWFAPRSAALSYRHSSMSYEETKLMDAKMSFCLCLFIGPAMMAYWAFRCYMFSPLKNFSSSRFENSLIKHDPGYRRVYEAKQDERIRRLERENERLTRQVLGK